MSLSKDEQELAKKLGFDEAAMLIIKETLAPQFGQVDLKPTYSGTDDFVTDNDYSGVLRPEDKANYENIEREYPELKPLIDRELNSYRSTAAVLEEQRALQEKQLKARLGIKKYERYQKYQAVRSQYQQLIDQEFTETQEQNHLRSSIRAVEKSDDSYLESDAALKQAIETLQKKYAGKSLNEPKNKYLVLGLRYKGPGISVYSDDKRLDELKEKLEPLGYRFEARKGIRHTQVFETKEEALNYLGNWLTTPEGLTLIETRAKSYEGIFPVDIDTDLKNTDSLRIIVHQSNVYIDPKDTDAIDQMAAPLLQMKDLPTPMKAFMVMRILPGTKIKKIGPRRWHLEQPARYEAVAVERTAIVSKVAPSDPGFDMITRAGTSGPNSGISTYDIIKQLKNWHQKYGITVLSAKHDSLTIRFTRLPDDLSEICTEHFLLGCETELHGDRIHDAANLRELAASIRKTKQLSFWWD